jgi:hypothetical protein
MIHPTFKTLRPGSGAKPSSLSGSLANEGGVVPAHTVARIERGWHPSGYFVVAVTEP